MIKPSCHSAEWIAEVANRYKYPDTQIIEKVIKALTLLELLSKSGCPFIFKGGSAVMLMLGDITHRLSIDVDIICPPGTEIEQYLTDYKAYGFTNLQFIERKSAGKNVPKSHSKFFYQLAYNNDNNKESYILLDVLYEDTHYNQVNNIDIVGPFLEIDGEPSKVRVPSVGDILGDKLTAYAPNTTGIPYYKNGNSRSMEIIKQLYDISRLFERVDELTITSKSFHRIAQVEMGYRGMEGDVNQIFEDIRQTSLLLATRGKAGVGDFALLQNGISRIKNMMFNGKYYIEDAIVDSARASYIATCIEKGISAIEKYDGDITGMMIAPTLTNKLEKLKKLLPEAYYYWCKTSEMLIKNNPLDLHSWATQST